MGLVGKIITIFQDKDKTKPVFPRTTAKAVTDKDGIDLDTILAHTVYSSDTQDTVLSAPVDADTLSGAAAADYMKKEDFVGEGGGEAVNKAIIAENAHSLGGNLPTYYMPWSATTNRNLLDNWYFATPINQRGMNHVVTESVTQYTVDRWLCGWNQDFTITDTGIVPNRTIELIQPLDDNIIKSIIGKTVTISLLTDSDLKMFTGIVQNNQTLGAGEISLKWGHAGKKCSFLIFSPNKIIAAKLEFGSHQTLAHQENNQWVLNEVPDYGEELRKCQRYYEVIYWLQIATGTLFDITVPFKVQKRASAINNNMLYSRNGTQGNVSYHIGSWVDIAPSVVSAPFDDRGGDLGVRIRVDNVQGVNSPVAFEYRASADI